MISVMNLLGSDEAVIMTAAPAQVLGFGRDTAADETGHPDCIKSGYRTDNNGTGGGSALLEHRSVHCS